MVVALEVGGSVAGEGVVAAGYGEEIAWAACAWAVVGVGAAAAVAATVAAQKDGLEEVGVGEAGIAPSQKGGGVWMAAPSVAVVGISASAWE